MKKKILTFLVTLGVILLPLTANASLIDEYEHKNFKDTLAAESIELKNKDYKETDDQITIYMFRGQGCDYCRSFLEFLSSISNEYGKYFKLVSFEVWENEENNTLFNKVATVTGEEAGGVPYIIIGETVYPGYISDWDDAIKTSIKTEYDKNASDRVDILEKAENYESEVKKAENAPYVKTIWWTFGFVVVATAAIITVNTIQNKKVLKALEELKSNKETKKNK